MADGDTERIVSGLLDRQAGLRANVDQLTEELWATQITLHVLAFAVFFAIGYMYVSSKGSKT